MPYTSSLLNAHSDLEMNMIAKKCGLYVYALILGIVTTKIGLDMGIAGSVNRIFVALAVMLVIFRKDISLEQLVNVRLLLSLYAVVMLMAFLSLYFTVDAHISMRYIRTNLIFTLIIFVPTYILFTFVNRRMFEVFLYSFVFSMIVLCVFMIVHYVQLYSVSGNKLVVRASATLGNLITPFANWHLMGFSMFVALAIFLRNWLLKILFAVCSIMAILALVASGSRTFTVCVAAVVAGIFVIQQYRHKKVILSVFIGLATCVCIYLINYSNNWNMLQGRFNAKNMVDNFIRIWELHPAEMGRFDGNCNRTVCSRFSLPIDPHIRQDQSSLIRLSLLKAGILAIAQNPLRPNGFGTNLFIKNISERFFPQFHINFPYFYLGSEKEDVSGKSMEFIKEAMVYNNVKPGQEISVLRIPYTHQHVHNQLVSYIFEIGIVGFIGVAGFAIIQFVMAHRNLVFFTRSGEPSLCAFSMFMMLCIIGDIVGMMFDIMLYRDGVTQLFILFAINTGLYFNSYMKGGYKCKSM